MLISITDSKGKIVSDLTADQIKVSGATSKTTKYLKNGLLIVTAKQGKTVIVVSSEMPEILGITNRIGVMSNGRLSGIVNTKETNQEELLRLSAKYL